MIQIADKLAGFMQIDSTSGREAAFLEALEAELSTLGFECDRQEVAPNRWNLLARRSEAPRFVYSTHVDTVPPYLPPRREGGTIYGRGACDTKGGIVAMLEAGKRLTAAGATDFGYLFVVGEEVDHCGAKAARTLGLRTGRIILCEPTENHVVSAQKGMIKLAVEAEGKAGHSAYPDRGVSAVHRLLDFLTRLRAHEWPSHDLLGPTTVNVGVIEGGVAANVFAPSARAEVLMRTVSDTEPLVQWIRDAASAIPGLVATVTTSNDPVFYDPPGDVDTTTVAFNTDATYLGEIAPVWLVGPGDIKVAHSDHEHIDLAQLAQGIDLYERLGRLAMDG